MAEGEGAGLWDSAAQFLGSLLSSGNKSQDTPLGEFGARANAVGGTPEGASAFAEQRKGEIGNPNYNPPSTTGYYTSLPNTARAENAAAQKSPEKPKAAGKTPALLDIPQVNPGASGIVDATPVNTPVTKTAARFAVTPQQSRALEALYGKNIAGMNDHVLYSIAKGDQSLGPYTPEQLVAYRRNAIGRAGGMTNPEQSRGTFSSILKAAVGNG